MFYIYFFVSLAPLSSTKGLQKRQSCKVVMLVNKVTKMHYLFFIRFTLCPSFVFPMSVQERLSLCSMFVQNNKNKRNKRRKKETFPSASGVKMLHTPHEEYLFGSFFFFFFWDSISQMQIFFSHLDFLSFFSCFSGPFHPLTS